MLAQRNRSIISVMKKLIITLFVLMFAVAATVMFFSFVFGGDEDTWICSGGQWVKHGNPSSPKPEGNCEPVIVQKAKDQLNDSGLCYSPNGSSMSYSVAKEKAQVGCKDGKLEENHSCNSSTGTWWIDFTPNLPNGDCNPACVVNVDSGSSEINWR